MSDKNLDDEPISWLAELARLAHEHPEMTEQEIAELIPVTITVSIPDKP